MKRKKGLSCQLQVVQYVALVHMLVRLVRNNKSRKLANLTQTMSNTFLLINITKVSQYLRSHVIQDQNLRLVRFFCNSDKIHCKRFISKNFRPQVTFMSNARPSLLKWRELKVFCVCGNNHFFTYSKRDK